MFFTLIEAVEVYIPKCRPSTRIAGYKAFDTISYNLVISPEPCFPYEMRCNSTSAPITPGHILYVKAPGMVCNLTHLTLLRTGYCQRITADTACIYFKAVCNPGILCDITMGKTHVLPDEFCSFITQLDGEVFAFHDDGKTVTEEPADFPVSLRRHQCLACLG